MDLDDVDLPEGPKWFNPAVIILFIAGLLVRLIAQICVILAPHREIRQLKEDLRNLRRENEALKALIDKYKQRE